MEVFTNGIKREATQEEIAELLEEENIEESTPSVEELLEEIQKLKEQLKELTDE